MMASNSQLGEDRLQAVPLKTIASPAEWADASGRVVPVQGSNACCQDCLCLQQAMFYCFSSCILASNACSESPG